jgi:tRNA dimethylallyltransferase
MSKNQRILRAKEANEPGVSTAILATDAGLAVVHNVLVVIGATASGKSSVAMEVARRVGGEILSADSMQVYRGMDIGTAKPTPAEREQVRHHLVDMVDPNRPFTVARFTELADDVIRDAQQRRVPLIVTGGTPLYYKALFEGLFDGPGSDDAVRDRLRAMSKEDMHRQLSHVDPAAAGRIHENDTKRLIRALEVFELTGKPISSFQTDWGSSIQRHPGVWIGLSWEKEPLNRRINSRVKDMMAAGWLDEVKRLAEQYGEFSETATMATGYQLIKSHLSRGVPFEDIVEEIKIETRQLARRQMKWFRRFLNVHWFSGDQPVEELATQAIALWRAKQAQPE